MFDIDSLSNAIYWKYANAILTYLMYTQKFSDFSFLSISYIFNSIHCNQIAWLNMKGDINNSITTLDIITSLENSGFSNGSLLKQSCETKTSQLYRLEIHSI